MLNEDCTLMGQMLLSTCRAEDQDGNKICDSLVSVHVIVKLLWPCVYSVCCYMKLR